MYDHLKAGWSVSLVAAIDFTASNGDPRIEGTNHYIMSDQLNNYEKALLDLGSAIEIEQYDNLSDQQQTDHTTFQVFGFGGIPRYMGLKAVNHCFALNGEPLNPEV